MWVHNVCVCVGVTVRLMVFNTLSTTQVCVCVCMRVCDNFGTATPKDKLHCVQILKQTQIKSQLFIHRASKSLEPQRIKQGGGDEIKRAVIHLLQTIPLNKTRHNCYKKVQHASSISHTYSHFSSLPFPILYLVLHCKFGTYMKMFQINCVMVEQPQSLQSCAKEDKNLKKHSTYNYVELTIMQTINS